MRFFKSLDQITAADAVRVGGKAYNCARLKQAGFPVPDGIAVMANARESSEVFSELQDWLRAATR
jgi:phosphoenolpyruvate synthase/pyruvate phosphate dikinase